LSAGRCPYNRYDSAVETKYDDYGGQLQATSYRWGNCNQR